MVRVKDRKKMPWPEVHGCTRKVRSCPAVRELIGAACTECLEKKKRNSGRAPYAREIHQKFPALTLREAELCSLLACRLDTSEISACLRISPRTVEKHIERIFRKLDIRSRGQLRQRLCIHTVAVPQMVAHHRGIIPAD